MKLNELLKSVTIQTDDTTEITDICSDTRQMTEGALFVALSGTQTDGEKYIEEAIQKGANAILCTHKPCSISVPCFETKTPIQDLAKLCTCFYNPFPETTVAVTGTNGKTSTVFFVRQLFEKLGKKSASIGTLGIQSETYNRYSGMTTTGVVDLAKDLKTLSEKGVTHVALEASSHGLHQGRLSCVRFDAAAFTNLTRDHLDYHQTMEAYLEAKALLFTERLKKGGTAVLNADSDVFDTLEKICKNKEIKVISYGKNGKDIRLISQTLFPTYQHLSLSVFGSNYNLDFPVAGAFQGMNVLAALGLVIACGENPTDVIPLLEEIHSPDGRMELVCQTKENASIFVDYAHTPDGIENALKSLRPITKGRLIILFGCGGNRDVGKRPIMGKIADTFADKVIITDDNPRFEDAEPIRKAILEACPKGMEIADRRMAIKQAVAMLEKDDVLLLAGKGHEEGQLIQGISHPFNDKHEAVLAVYEKEKEPLWTNDDIKKALDIEVQHPFKAFGISIDSRTTNIGDLYINLTNNAEYNKQALQKGAVAVITTVFDEKDERFITVKDSMVSFRTLAFFSRNRTTARIIGITGSSGKTTTKEMLGCVLRAYGSIHLTQGNYNNQLGVPLTLCTLPQKTDFAVIEMGMNHTGEMRDLTHLTHPEFSLITMIGWAHREFFKSLSQIAEAKAEIFEATQKGVILGTECAEIDLLCEKANPLPITFFGKAERADVRLLATKETDSGTVVSVDYFGKPLTYTLSVYGSHFVSNSLGVLAVLNCLGLDVQNGINCLKDFSAVKGRGQKTETFWQGKKITVVDESYNANPSSMKAALTSFKKIKGTRHIAVLGDMLELGEYAEEMHLDLLPYLEGIDKIYTVGPLMQRLFEKLPEWQKGNAVSKASDILSLLSLEDGDIVCIKGSNGSYVHKITDELLKGKK